MLSLSDTATLLVKRVAPSGGLSNYLYFMGLNVSNEHIAHELSIHESDAYQMTTELRGGMVKKASRDPLQRGGV